MARVPTDGHGGAGPEGGEKVIVGVGRRLGAAGAKWFVCPQSVLADGDLLLETAGAAADNHVRRRCVN